MARQPPRLFRKPPTTALFALVILLPALLLAGAALAGGALIWVAFLSIAVLIALLDRLIARAFPDAPEGAEFPAAAGFSLALGLGHFLLLGLVLHGFAAGVAQGPAQGVALFLAAGLFLGQVSNSNAHELIHRRDRLGRWLGVGVYVSLLFGHHASAHPKVHHIHVATPQDPNSARLGESFWAFWPRAWIGSFRAGLAAERALRRRAHRRGPTPYALYLLGSAGCIALIWALWGGWVSAIYLGLCLHAQMQILLADYVQHYGLRRSLLPNGRYEPAGPRHSWDAAAPVSSLWMLNAPRHSDHHAHPARPYPALRLGALDLPGRPVLPRALPVMATLALWPRLWRKVMDPRLARLQQAEPCQVSPR